MKFSNVVLILWPSRGVMVVIVLVRSMHGCFQPVERFSVLCSKHCREFSHVGSYADPEEQETAENRSRCHKRLPLLTADCAVLSLLPPWSLILSTALQLFLLNLQLMLTDTKNKSEIESQTASLRGGGEIWVIDCSQLRCGHIYLWSVTFCGWIPIGIHTIGNFAWEWKSSGADFSHFQADQ